MAKSSKPITSVSKKGNESTSAKMATIAAKTLLDPKETTREKQLAGALLNQTPDKSQKSKPTK